MNRTLTTDEQMKASYTQSGLVELAELKNDLLPSTHLPTGYKRLNKTALVALIRIMDKAFDDLTAPQQENLGTFIKLKRAERSLSPADVFHQCGIMVLAQAEIESNYRYPTERELMQYRSLDFLPAEEDSEEESHTCEVCDKDITTGGYLAEWSGDTFCSIEHAQIVLNYDEINEGQQDNTFFWTDWMGEEQ